MEEKPLECSQCKKSTDVIYTEIKDCKATTWHMCKDCPTLFQKLHHSSANESLETRSEQKEPLICSDCQTSLSSIITGGPLGCESCYQVFKDLITKNLKAAFPTLENHPPLFHVGKSPDQSYDLSHTKRITTLNEDLNKALKQENYEKAAFLRDEIKLIMEQSHE